MVTTLFRTARTAVAALCLAPLAGCATTATINKLAPALADVANVRRVAVLYCAGPADSGQVVHRTIVSKLMENGYYSLVDPAKLERFASAPLYNQEGKADRIAAIEAARRMRLDAILVAQARYREGGTELGGSTIQIGDPTVTARVDFELIDVRTGRVLSKDRTLASYRGELTRDRTGPTSRKKVLTRLAEQAAEEVVERIAPHQASFDVQLAAPAFGAGSGALRRGNKLAREGDWERAIELWQQTLADHPESDTAMYNLGLAYEALSDFGRARQMYSAAINQSDTPRYQQALDRVERNSHAHQLALAQIHRPPTQPTSSLTGYRHQGPVHGLPGAQSQYGAMAR